MHPAIPSALILVLAAPAYPSVPDLAALEALAMKLEGPWSPETARQKVQLQSDLVRLLDGDQLRTGAELHRAAKATPWLWPEFETARQRYELTLAAVALGDAEALPLLQDRWERFLMSTGRRPHTGSQKRPPFAAEQYVPQWTVQAVCKVLADPIGNRKRAAGLVMHAGLQKLMEADQAARQGDMMGRTPAEMEAFARADADRQRLLRKLLGRAIPLNARDFANASLLMQHGSWFEDYALAHELALCATILDPSEGRELLAVTYDRMLESMGHRQRIGTQYGGDGSLAPIDPIGFSDTMRKALGRKPLAEIPKTFN